MNIEIANRLVNLRKSNGLSQEALAEKLGISRQAVSKWERAEASPDTDNLIMLARLYGVSLDELLRTEDEIPIPEPVSEEPVAEALITEEEQKEYVHVGFEGVHVKDKDGSEVHVGWNGIHVDETKGDHVHIDKNGVYINGRKYDREWLRAYHRLPVTALLVVLYIFLGVFFSAWHPAWLLFLLPPLWYSFIEAVERRNPHVFAYPVLATLLFLCVGIFFGAWHPGWVIFLTIPVYYPLVSFLMGKEDED